MLESFWQPMREVPSALAWAWTSFPIDLSQEAATPMEPTDLRCTNEECTLFALKLEPDEISPEPGDRPDRCAECGQPLGPYVEDQS
jgi:hypothetical protein